ncbi:hypothetical protein LWP59_21180 [Amycolatopsis acidiphila]|uniref:Uncharacterized protein n=1 Tax=Amycolatopsis acidiphila TaxID=715473 RepID=A0A558A268_9PSEU|nr:hypothetical protein [Amycolatopsis acidiphila]TVT18354.1 hypothetical protein FNH06_28190 [Amycolatopsis acidiphila]UIJ56698.1 hypothetical protein LWP59_21180 [Amycolatopsis acidiphila]GHG55704.1 hypothetical protein GCM10017788_06460 [Amycolatopsis acidiphila]
MRDADLISGGLVDEGLARRLKALACTAPLHDLDARKAKLDWADATVYQMAEIALHTIDQVTIAMDFDTGADHEDVVRRLQPFIAAQAPGRGGEEHLRVARWVLDNLINVGTADRGFRRVYGSVDATGAYRRRAFDFKLLVELAAPDGEVYLRASDEAINVLVGALDTDVESAQIAAEVKLENLISRGRLADAKLAAEQARYRTVQYGETLRAKLDATRRDVRAVDWAEEMPELLDSALSHIEARFRAENAILRNITRARDEAEDPGHKRRAAELVDIVGDCISRHTRLQSRLQAAGAVFRAEQDRQQFSGPPQRATIDLFGQLLVPSLELPIADAVKPVEGFFHAVAGLNVPVVPALSSLVSLLLRPVPERDKLVGEVPEPELVPSETTDHYSDEQWRRADELLDLPEVPRRLSGLLAEARELDPHVARLVALRALHSYSPEVGAAVRQGDDRTLLAVDDGTLLDDAEFGGADLLLATARIERAHDEEGVA